MVRNIGFVLVTAAMAALAFVGRGFMLAIELLALPATAGHQHMLPRTPRNILETRRMAMEA